MGKEPKYSDTYSAFENYRNGYFSTSNVKAKLEQVRAFYSGKQYEDTADDLPKPLINICRETVQKYVAKILETPIHISFVSDQDDITLKKLDDFYEYQTSEIGDEEIRSEVVERGFVDGIGISLTAFDKDTDGLYSSFKGFLKRQVIPFEDMFFENPFNKDIQSQGYIGYFTQMSIKAVKEVLKSEYKNELKSKEYKAKLDLIVPEDYFTKTNGYADYNTQLIDEKIVNVYVLLFRVKGEVYFDMSTKYCSVFKKAHALNPNKNDIDFDSKEIIDSEKFLIYEKAEKKGRENESKKFSRYPVQVFIPYPLTRSLIGESVITMLIPNQKNINYIFLLVMLIIQNHAMPKILVKPETLNGQEYDNSPNQIIVDYTSITSGTQWGITRLNGDGAINSNLLDIGSTLIALTQNIFGTNNLTANGTDLSGFAYQQIVAQNNLILEQPQKRYFYYLKETAKNDLLYFRFYIDDEANYYGIRSEAETRLDERYRELSQDIEIRNNPNNPRVLPKTPRVEKITINKEIFDKDFAVIVDVETGVASSVVSESQHYQTIFQYVASGNIDSDKIRVLVENDPALSAKLRQRFTASLDELEVSQLAMKDAEIERLKQVVNQLVSNLETANSNLDILKARDEAREKALRDTAKEAQAVVKTAVDNQGGLLTESQVKSNNAKGISGTSFSN